MKREVLFRGKRIDNNEWVYGDLIHTPEGKTRIIWFEPMYSGDIHFYKDYNFMVDKETIGQFTGLTDKNGVKIFENDTINVPYNNIGNTTVEYLNEKCRYNISNYNLSKIYVIGNIHDNKKNE